MALTRNALRSLNLLALAALLAVGAFQMGHARASREQDNRRKTAVVDAVSHAAPAVVSVTSRSAGRRTWTEGAGAGVIVHPAGYVVTNSHVVKGARTISVELFRNGGVFTCDKILDQPMGDLALLKIRLDSRGRSVQGRRFPYVSCCAGGKVMLGESAIAIGNPRGLGDTITVGVVSALGRDAKMSNGVEMRNLIQTDASINTGNSGGALLNLDGELMGVIVSLLPRASGIAFAIPASKVCALLQQALGGSPPANPLPPSAYPPVIARGPAAKPETSGTRAEGTRGGATGTSGTRANGPTQTPPARRRAAPSASRSDTGPRATPPSRTLPPPKVEAPKTSPMRAKDFGITLQDTGASLRVSNVQAGSTAHSAGLRAGDLLLSIEGRPVESDLDVVLSFSQARPGRIYQLQVRRGQSQHRIRLATPAR